MESRKRVCIIGAGPSGMALMNAFMSSKKQGVEIPEIVCFEKQKEMGGLWNFSWRTGLDENGEPNHGSMYRYLWSNGPKECLEMADYTFDEHFQKAIPSYPPRLVLRDYLMGKAHKHGISGFIRTKHVVRNVEENQHGKYEVTYEKLDEGKRYTETFDYVCVASGHYSTPNYPTYDGVDSFTGPVLHAHDFKDAASYKDKRILLVGSRYSAEDIALQLYKYGAKEVVISYRTKPMGYNWPTSIREVPLLTKIDKSTIHFVDGQTYNADAIIFCTGYRHHFPFMSNKLRLHCTNIAYPDHLYKGCIYNESTNLIYLSMQDQSYTFTMFDAEAWFARDYILGKIKIPSKEERSDDIKKLHTQCLTISTEVGVINFQRDFIADLLKYTDYPKHDLAEMGEMLKAWLKDKEDNILTYREKCYKSSCTGTMGVPLYAPWVEAMDDSLEMFINA